MDYITLKNGVKMPVCGFGSMNQHGEMCIDNVAFALNNGFDLIDTANRYGNEVEVGLGIKKSGRNREDFLVETKLGPTLYETPGAVEATVERLGLDYVDIFLVHHPLNNYLNAYKMIEKAYKNGKVRAIGLSNFPEDKIREVLNICDVEPVIMQVECHPYYPAEEYLPYARDIGLTLQSWYPLGHGNKELLSEPVLKEIGDKYGKTPVQVILRWHIQGGFTLVPCSTSKEHIIENTQIYDFALTDDDMALIDGLNRHSPMILRTPEHQKMLATAKCVFEK